MLPIADIAQRIGIDADGIEPFGQYKAKLIAETLRALRKRAHPRYRRNADEYGGGKVDRFDRACRCTQ